MLQVQHREGPADAAQKPALGPARDSVRTGRSTHTGLTYDKNTSTWRVRVNIKSKQHHVGRFKEEAEAAVAYDCAALLLIGPSAAVNFGPAAARAAMPRYINRINITALMRLKQTIDEMPASYKKGGNGAIANASSGGSSRGRNVATAVAVPLANAALVSSNETPLLDAAGPSAGLLAIPGMPAPWGAFGGVGHMLPSAAPQAPASCPLPLVSTASPQVGGSTGLLPGSSDAAGRSGPLLSFFDRFVPCGPLPGANALSAPLPAGAGGPPPLASTAAGATRSGPLPAFYQAAMRPAAVAAAASLPAPRAAAHHWAAHEPTPPLISLLPDRNDGPGAGGDDDDDDDSAGMDAEWVCIRTADDARTLPGAATAPSGSCDGSSAPSRPVTVPAGKGRVGGGGSGSGTPVGGRGASPVAPGVVVVGAVSEAAGMEFDLDDEIDHMVRLFDCDTGANRTVLAAAAAATAAAAGPLQQLHGTGGDGYEIAFAAAAAAAASVEFVDCDGDDADSGAAARRRGSWSLATGRSLSLSSNRSDVSSYLAGAATAPTPAPPAAGTFPAMPAPRSVGAAASAPVNAQPPQYPRVREEQDDCYHRAELFRFWATEDASGAAKPAAAPAAPRFRF